MPCALRHYFTHNHVSQTLPQTQTWEESNGSDPRVWKWIDLWKRQMNIFPKMTSSWSAVSSLSWALTTILFELPPVYRFMQEKHNKTSIYCDCTCRKPSITAPHRPWAQARFQSRKSWYHVKRHAVWCSLLQFKHHNVYTHHPHTETLQ